MIGLVLMDAAGAAAANQAALGDGIHFTPVQIVIGVLAGLGGVGTVMNIIKELRSWGKDKDAGLKAMRDDIVNTTRSGHEAVEKKLSEVNSALECRMAELHRQTVDELEDLEKRVDRVENRSAEHIPESKITLMITEKVDEVRHRHGGELQKQLQRINSLESFRGQDIERIVKLETNMVNIEKSVSRIEHAVEKLGTDMGTRIDGWADKLALSIREVRNVSPKGS